jgi:shikimate kinase
VGAELSRELPKRVLLLGFMGAGKTTIGPILARRLGWQFLDLDVEIARTAGLPVPEIFAREGEAGFRRREAEATRRVIEREAIVLAPGGGWVANEAAARALPAGTVRVWLQVTAEEVLRRLGTAGADRPLLAVADPRATIRSLLAAREPLYRAAELAVPTEGRSAPEIAADIESLLKGRGSAAPSS